MEVGSIQLSAISDGTFVARSHAGHARLRPIDRDSTVAPGITAVRAPGHTPGHFPELKFGRVLQGNGKRWWT